MNKKIKYSLIVLGFLLFSIFFIPNKPVYALVDNGRLYNIVNKGSGKYLNVNNGTDANGTNVIQWSPDGSIEQIFRPVYYSSKGAFRIYAMCSDKGANRVLDVLRTGGSSSGSIISGNNVDIWSTGDDDCQYFTFVPENLARTEFSIRLKSNSNLVLTAYGEGNGSGAGNTSTSVGNVYISTYTGSSNQIWMLRTISATPAYPYRMTKGIGNQNYYVHSSASNYITHITNGTNSWNPTIQFSRANDNSSTAVDFYSVPGDTFTEDGWLAVTHWAIPSSYVDPIIRGWSYGEVRFNSDDFLTETANNTERQIVVAHEIGHCFGLMHYGVSDTIMRAYLSDITVSTPQNVDREGLTRKY